MVLVISHGWMHSAPPFLPSPAPLSQPSPESIDRTANAANVELSGSTHLSPSSTSSYRRKVLIREDTSSQLSPSSTTINSSIALIADNTIEIQATFTLPATGSSQFLCGFIYGKAYNKEGSVVFVTSCQHICLHEEVLFFHLRTRLSNTWTREWIIPSDMASKTVSQGRSRIWRLSGLTECMKTICMTKGFDTSFFLAKCCVYCGCVCLCV